MPSRHILVRDAHKRDQETREHIILLGMRRDRLDFLLLFKRLNMKGVSAGQYPIQWECKSGDIREAPTVPIQVWTLHLPRLQPVTRISSQARVPTQELLSGVSQKVLLLFAPASKVLVIITGGAINPSFPLRPRCIDSMAAILGIL
jgi:hypothetical protein